MYQKLLFSSCLALFSSFAFAQSQTPKNQAVERIDIQQYAGKWYEIAHLPMFFQRNCVGDTTAEYQLNSDNTVKVVNRCRNKQNQIDQAEGVAYPQNEGKSKLKVSFLPKGLRWVPFTKGIIGCYELIQITKWHWWVDQARNIFGFCLEHQS